MKHCYFFSLIAIGALVAGCKQQAERATDVRYTIDFEQCFDTEQPMLVSEIADQVEYLELKTPDDVIITRIWDVKQLDDYLFIKARWDVYLFHKNGQFIRQVGSRGQGPEEYLVSGKPEIDRKKKEIIIADTEKFLFYDLEGNFLRSKKWKNDTKIGLSDTVIWISRITTNRQKSKAIAVSSREVGDTLAYIPNSLCDPNISSTWAGTSSTPYTRMFYHKNDTLYFKGDEANDTIWKLSGIRATPYASIAMGKYKMPIEYESWYFSFDEYRKNADRYWGVSSLVEDDRYFFLFS
jgi:hypothetical protein